MNHHWQVAKTWIETNGGFVHPSLLQYYDSTKNHRRIRRVIIYSPSSNHRQHDTTFDNNNSSHSSRSSSALHLEAGTTLLEIPQACLLTLHSVEGDAEFGKSLFGVVHSLSNKDYEKEDVGRTIHTRHGSHVNVAKSIHHHGGGLYHDAQDVILALYLAYLRERLLNENDSCARQQGEKTTITTTANESETSPPMMDDELTSSHPKQTTAIPLPPWRFYEPYISTLPLPLPLLPSQSANNHNNANPSSSNASSPIVSSPSSNNDQSHHLPLPRQWSMTTIRHRLEGTSLYSRVRKERHGINTEYELVKRVWTNNHSSPQRLTSFPTFENYDTMMAMVTSRGFANLGYDGVDALIPMLDLLDHSRGEEGRRDNVLVHEEVEEGVGWEDGGGSNRGSYQRGLDIDKILPSVLESSRVLGPNVRYSRYYCEDDGDSELWKGDETERPLSKRQKITLSYDDFLQGRGGGVRVIASQSIPPGSILQMTYGAKGNVALLGRYGFCISNNLEPDGSCNDVLEIEIKANAPPVKLQRGPKSYAYGPFVHALELCYDHHANGNHVSRGYPVNAADDDGDRRIGVDDGDLEDFLDSCDNECNDEDGTANEDDIEVDESSEVDDDFGDNGTSRSRYDSMMNDICAIDALSDILLKVKTGLVNNPLSKWMHETNLTGHDNVFEDADRYCSILIHSEIQTVDFFLAVGSECRRRLVEHVHEIPMSKELSKGMESVAEIESVVGDDFIVTESTKEQIIAIGEAFSAIRY